jgi:esterase/lipase superfamily enzyme
MNEQRWGVGLLLGLSLTLGCSAKDAAPAASAPADTAYPSEGEPQTGGAAPHATASEATPPSDWPAGGAAPPHDEVSSYAPDVHVRAMTAGSAPPLAAEPQFAPQEDHSFSMFAPFSAEPAASEPPPESTPRDAPRAPHSTAAAEPAAAAPVTPRIAARAAAPPPQEKYHVVNVFYGTDRAPLEATPPDLRDYVRHYRGALGVLAGTLVISGFFLLISQPRALLIIGVSGGIVASVLGVSAMTRMVKSRYALENEIVQYGDGRGALEMGLCRVSIPFNHTVGEVESPSILRLEFREDPERHVSILEAREYEPERFFHRLRDTVAASSRRELLVFIHGYNVSFDSAVRRTAQIAYDLKFPGAAVCYSWPSHGGLLLYSADENNVEWTVPHLKEFLGQLREKSGADAINLVGHSMGTRALSNALREFAREMQQDNKLFNQVVLAAPDIDAEVFRRDLAPAMTKVAQRVTLYASSNDQALMASRTIHAYPRAGESGANLVVAPGLDTIDVSAIDSSLLGHSYYGDNDSIIADLYHVVHESLPPDRRHRLQMAKYAGLPYWIFVPAAAAQAALPGSRIPQ